jgi:hypothetical protein
VSPALPQADSEAPGWPVELVDGAVENFLDACGGDARRAVRLLMEERSLLEAELAAAMELISAGYARLPPHRGP